MTSARSGRSPVTSPIRTSVPPKWLGRFRRARERALPGLLDRSSGICRQAKRLGRWMRLFGPSPSRSCAGLDLHAGPHRRRNSATRPRPCCRILKGSSAVVHRRVGHLATPAHERETPAKSSHMDMVQEARSLAIAVFVHRRVPAIAGARAGPSSAITASAILDPRVVVTVRCLGTGTIDASMIWPPIARLPTCFSRYVEKGTAPSAIPRSRVTYFPVEPHRLGVRGPAS